MNEFEERLNAVLSDPAELEKLSRLAAQLMGEQPGGTQTEAAAPAELPAGLWKAMGAGNKTALLEALEPYLQPERRARLRKALRVAGLARAARAALDTLGGDDAV